ncbi:MAG TPA: hypothetical protein VGO16_05465 [Pseudonocardiaceae bacterium]|jgi:hypothetical protein|nr:hypothetical protein [Pseudonocardiaceae bacterium]
MTWEPRRGRQALAYFSTPPITKNVVSQPVLDALGQAVERVGREAFTACPETEPQMTDKIE